MNLRLVVSYLVLRGLQILVNRGLTHHSLFVSGVAVNDRWGSYVDSRTYGRPSLLCSGVIVRRLIVAVIWGVRVAWNHFDVNLSLITLILTRVVPTLIIGIVASIEESWSTDSRSLASHHLTLIQLGLCKVGAWLPLLLAQLSGSCPALRVSRCLSWSQLASSLRIVAWFTKHRVIELLLLLLLLSLAVYQLNCALIPQLFL